MMKVTRKYWFLLAVGLQFLQKSKIDLPPLAIWFWLTVWRK